MTTRPALKSDASSIAAISLEVWLGAYIRRGVNAFFADYALSEFTTDKIAALIAAPNETFIISENAEGIDGFIRITSGKFAPVADQSCTEVTTMYVQPRHQGKGIGKRLLGNAVQLCRAVGVTSVWLAVNAENTAAIAFYISQGFVKTGHSDFHIRDQAYLNDIMTLQIGKAG